MILAFHSTVPVPTGAEAAILCCVGADPSLQAVPGVDEPRCPACPGALPSAAAARKNHPHFPLPPGKQCL